MQVQRNECQFVEVVSVLTNWHLPEKKKFGLEDFPTSWAEEKNFVFPAVILQVFSISDFWFCG